MDCGCLDLAVLSYFAVLEIASVTSIGWPAKGQGKDNESLHSRGVYSLAFMTHRTNTSLFSASTLVCMVLLDVTSTSSTSCVRRCLVLFQSSCLDLALLSLQLGSTSSISRSATRRANVSCTTTAR